MKKVLIITYYWPPSGGAGVQRWLKFVKYLREFNWEPVVYTAENGEIPSVDHSLAKDIPLGITVLKQPVWEPYDLYKRFTGVKKEEKVNAGFLSETEKPKLAQKVAVWIRGNFFIPDARRFWIKPSVKYLKDYLKENPVDAIVSTGPPHSMHLIALELKKHSNLPWLADFRDPWTNIDYYDQLMLSKMADMKHKSLEKKVIETADVLVTVGTTMKEEFLALGASEVEVITNGFDEEDLQQSEITLDEKFSLAHIGSLVSTRNPESLWRVLKSLISKSDEFKNDLEIKLVGKVDFEAINSLKKYNLYSYLNKKEYVPHDDVIKIQQESQVLLLLLNNTRNVKGILTGKFFEYLASKRPILCIGPKDSEVAEILIQTQAGEIAGFEDETKLEEIILDYYQKYKQKNLFSSSTGIEKYSRKNLTFELSTVLNNISRT
ncbi:MAG: glycosyl transferase family 1 [Bacteroidota bacterium]|nr:glycosyl transferase family 1 [Bacteroidota bacterium]